jgi:MmyB-like transcription regulator ligand binding domain
MRPAISREKRADCGTPLASWHGVSLSRRGLSLAVYHMCAPPCNQGAPAAATCTSITPCSRLIRSTPGLRNQRVSLTTRLITKLPANPLAPSRSMADAGAQSPPQGRPPPRSTVDGMEKVGNDTVALLSAEAGRHPYDRRLSDLIGELSTGSDEFVSGGPPPTSRSTAPASSSSTT